MARARNIKPGFFKNEILGVADPLYSLLFEGLWVLADRGGKLEDRPLRIKGEIFPYRDSLNMDAMLDWLFVNGFINRYQVGSKKYILVLEFVKHQNPHKNESESDIPDPEEIGTSSEIIGSTRADSLSSDSGFLIPDSLNSDSLLAAANAASPTSGPSPIPPAPKPAAPPSAPAADRGSRLPKPWVLPKALGDWALEEFPAWTADTVRIEASKFADFWHAKSGKDAAKLDWPATWRNWCRNARSPPGSGQPQLNKQEALEARNRRIAEEWANDSNAGVIDAAT